MSGSGFAVTDEARGPEASAEALIALGSNLGDRLRTLRDCVSHLETLAGIRILAASSVYESEPVGPVRGQPPFLNAGIRVASELDPSALLQSCLQTEDHFGRVRTVSQGPRTLDLDLIAHRRVPRVSLPDLTLPHPRATERAFVLYPLAEIAPDWRIENRTLREWATKVDPGGIRIFASGVLWK